MRLNYPGKICVSVLFPFVAFFQVHSASAQASFIDTLLVPPQVTCADVPVLERIKYSRCEFRYFEFDLPEYLEALKIARIEGLSARRDRVWDWLDLLPKPNCDNVPAAERPKFFFHCDTTNVGLDLLGNLQGRLASLRADRDMMARRIEELRVQYDNLVERTNIAPPGLEAREMVQLTTALETLDQSLSRVALMEQMSAALSGQSDLPAVRDMAFITLPASVALWGSSTEDAETLGTTSPSGDMVIKIETTSSDARSIMVIHPVLGLGYTTQEQLDAN